MTIQSGIIAYVYTNTSITLKYVNGDTYRYDVSKAFNKENLTTMINLAKSGSGLNRYLNNHPQIKKYGYLDSTLRDISFSTY